MTEDRVLPHSLEAEKAVLGCLLMSADAWHEAASLLRPDDFFRDAHARVFKAAARLADRGVPTDMLPLVEELRAAGDMDEVGGAAYLSSLTDGVPKGSNLSHYCGIVREKSRLRRIVEAGMWLAAQGYEGTETSAKVADVAARRLLGLVETQDRGLTTAEAAIEAYVGSLGTPAADPLPTGYADLDRVIAGLRPADLAIVAGRPSTGKTSFGVGIAEYMASVGKRSLVFSMEMPASGIAARLLGWRSQVPSAKIERGTATDDEFAIASATATRGVRDGATALLIEEHSRTVTEVSAWCRKVQQDGGLHCVVVDYLQLLVPETRYQSRQEEVAAISRSLKRLAKDLGIVMVALSQLSRASKDRKDKRPQLDDLRESGALEQDSDLVLLLFREEMYQRTEANAGVAECIIAKNRQGPTGVTRLQWEAELAQFRDLHKG